jgi:hypothetical protein
MTNLELEKAKAAVEQARSNLEESTRDLGLAQDCVNALAAAREQLPYSREAIAEHVENEGRARLSLEVAQRMVTQAQAGLEKALAAEKQAEWQFQHDQLEEEALAIVRDYDAQCQIPMNMLVKYLERLKRFEERRFGFNHDRRFKDITTARRFIPPHAALNWTYFDEIRIIGKGGIQAWPISKPYKRWDAPAPDTSELAAVNSNVIAGRPQAAE